MTTADLTALVGLAALAVAAPILVELCPKPAPPVVVMEILLGIVFGPQVLDLIRPDSVTTLLSSFGLAFLFFAAGMEIDLARIRGTPMRLASAGWAISMALALAIAGGLQLAGFVLSATLVGACLTTTSLGALLPILGDAGELDSPFGDAAMACGAMGELGPIVLIALLFGSDSDVVTGIVRPFAAVVAAVTIIGLRIHPARLVRLLRETMHRSAQLPVRLTMLLLVVLVYLATQLKLDVILGAFAAGLIVGIVVRNSEHEETLRIKIDALGFGFLIPIFFISSGLTFDLNALVDSPRNLARLPVFAFLFLLVRGLPALLWRGHLPERDLLPLGLLSATGLPLIVAITTIGVQTHDMRSDTAAALVGAGMLSVLVFPLVALTLRRAGAAAAPAVPDSSAPPVL